MRNVILGLLLHGPMSLYDLHKAFSASAAMFYSASYGSLKHALTGLINSGQVRTSDSPVGARARTLHTITPRGRATWRAWMLEPIATRSNDTALIAKAFFLGDLEPADRAVALDLLQQRARQDLDELRDLGKTIAVDEIPAEYQQTAHFRLAALDYGIREGELALRWLESLGDPETGDRGRD